MTSLTGNLACFVNRASQGLRGIIGIHMDDSIGTGTLGFIKEIKVTSRSFDSEEIVFNNMTFVDVLMKKTYRRSFCTRLSTRADR